MNRMKVKRKGQMWVSNNRMLLGLGPNKKDIGRNPNFDAEETKLLISLWGDPKVQKTLITTHRKHLVIAKLAEKMNEYGYNRSAEEINTRIKNLKCFYNRLKKDMDIGINTGSTWKHFKAMDEIMNRSVFSVRPDEIPKPSLKYQLEVEQIEREEREKLQAASGKTDEQQILTINEATDNGMDNSEDDFGERNDIQLPMDYSDDSVNPIKIKEEDDSNDASLLIPKEEPFDEDEVIFHDNPNETKMPTETPNTRLPDFIQLPNNNNNNNKTNSSSMGGSSNCRTLVNCNINNTLQTSSPSPSVNGGIPQSIIISNQGNSMQPTGKISLVPTNFLLQNGAQSPQIQLRPQPQPRIICTQPNATTNTGIVTSAGAGRMKVLLVNAFQNGKPTNATVSKDSSFSNPSLIPTPNIHKTTTPDTGTPKIPADVPKQGKIEETPSTKDPGIEMLFNKLIVMQTENNEIQRQRLEIERQRFEFEKTIADKLLLALTSFSQVQRPEYITPNNAMPSNAEQYSVEKENSQESLEGFSTYQLLTPKVEKSD